MTALAGRVPALVRTWSWAEWRHHPWQTGAALVAIALGVALAWSVHLVNASALQEFASAVRSTGGEPDLRLVARDAGGFADAVYARVAAHPGVRLASPVVEGSVSMVAATASMAAGGASAGAASNAPRPVAVRVVGVDALVAPLLAPALTLNVSPATNPATNAATNETANAATDTGTDTRYAVLDPHAVFLNAEAAERLGVRAGGALRVPGRDDLGPLRVAGHVATGGPALVALDIAGAQALLQRIGRLDRLDLRLAPGASPEAVVRDLALPDTVRVAAADEGVQRISNVSRAYRVNLTVLALVALFTGAFLVYSVLALSLARRQRQFALLGVLGLAARERQRLAVAESALLGIAGSLVGLALGTAFAALALDRLGGDLGGGYFAGVAPTLRIEPLAAAWHLALGVVAAVVGGWLPARAAARLAPAQALKGLGSATRPTRKPLVVAVAGLAAGVALALLPPVAGLPLFAYAAVACLLVGGIAAVPWCVGALLAAWPDPRGPLTLLAVECARHDRGSATIAIAGVVASLALSVALTVMVTSFRDAVIDWLDVVLPADLYVRSGAPSGPGAARALPAGLADAVAALPGVRRVGAQRVLGLALDPTRPDVALIARPLDDPARDLPLAGTLVPAPAGAASAPAGVTPVYVSEAMVDLYGARAGTMLALPLPGGGHASVHVRGVWRDYARQFGAIAIDRRDWQRLAHDDTVNDLAIWLQPGADAESVERAIRAAARGEGGEGSGGGEQDALAFASPREIRALSLRIFDRSFAVTWWLQAVAIAIGLVGIAASYSAQALARQREFGLLAHLGYSRRQVLAIVAGEGAAWSTAGAVLGVLLGLAVSVVLVHVVNPQSFHWTMPLTVPWPRVVGLAAAVVLAATATATLAARRVVRQEAVLAVKDDT